MTDNNNKSNIKDTARTNSTGTTMTATEGSPTAIGEKIHPISQINVSDALSACLKSRWIENVEQAVAYLASINFEIVGKEEFLAQARDILGEEAYAKYTKPVPKHPLGCIDIQTEEHFMKQVEGSKTEDCGGKETP